MTQTLNAATVLALAEIVNVCRDSAKVARVNSDGNIVYGIARHIVKSPDNCGFLSSNQDIREGYLRVTNKNGFEHFWAIEELLPEISARTFVRYDW